MKLYRCQSNVLCRFLLTLIWFSELSETWNKLKFETVFTYLFFSTYKLILAFCRQPDLISMSKIRKSNRSQNVNILIRWVMRYQSISTILQIELIHQIGITQIFQFQTILHGNILLFKSILWKTINKIFRENMIKDMFCSGKINDKYISIAYVIKKILIR